MTAQDFARQLRESIKRNGQLNSDLLVLALELNKIREHTMKSYQLRVRNWVVTCFGVAVADDVVERNYRFLEEALELVQSLGCSKEDALKLVDYVYGRPVGEPRQEVGGVETTLNALCSAAGIEAADAAEAELARIWGKIEVIREKQKQKPRFVSADEEVKIDGIPCFVGDECYLIGGPDYAPIHTKVTISKIAGDEVAVVDENLQVTRCTPRWLTLSFSLVSKNEARRSKR